MSNPARELHELYSNWREALAGGNNSMRNVLDPVSPSSTEVSRAMRLLTRLDDLIRAFDPDGSSVWRRQYPNWTFGAIAWHVGWSTAAKPDQVMLPDHMDQIEAFASFLDGKVFEYDASHEADLRRVLAQARDLLEADGTIDDPLRQYIHRLLRAIQTALDDAAVGVGFDMAEAVQRLWVSLRAAESASAESKNLWRDIWTQLLAGTVSGFMVEAGIIGARALTGL